MLQWTRTFTKLIGALPLPGMAAVQDLSGAVFSAENRSEKCKAIAAATGFIGLLQAGHMTQTVMCGLACCSDLNRLAMGAGGVNAVRATINGTIALLSLGVVGSHTVLLTRLWARYLKDRGRKYIRGRSVSFKRGIGHTLAGIALVLGANALLATSSNKTPGRATAPKIAAPPNAPPQPADWRVEPHTAAGRKTVSHNPRAEEKQLDGKQLESPN